MSERDAAVESPPRRPWSVGEHGTALRAIGLLFAAPFLLGLLGGSVVVPAAGIALAALVRLAQNGALRTRALPGLALYLGAVAVGAARWETFELGLIRGAQAVLGPTVMVAPPGAAAAAAVAWVAGTVALGLWLRAPEEGGVELWLAEAGAGALLLVTVFWGPALPGLGAPGTFTVRGLLWLLFTGATGAAAASIGSVTVEWGRWVGGVLVGFATVGVVVAALLLGSAL